MPADPPGSRPADLAPEERLDSWKAIAAYLGRDVRTVQRWERREGMPVRRHRHDQQASIYAYRSELEVWRRARGTQERQPSAAASVGTVMERRSTPRLLGGGLVLATLTFGLLASIWVARPPTPAPSAGTSSGLTLLLADVEASVDLEPLARDLRQEVADAWRASGGAIVPDDHVRSFLSLMRQPQDRRLSPALAGEVAERAGGIPLIVELGLARSAASFQVRLTAWLGDGTLRELARFETAASSASALPGLVRTLVARLAVTASAVPRQATLGLLRVTTASPVALQQYDEADRLMRRGSWDPAAVLLRGAVAADPTFASAHIHLGWVLFNRNRPLGEWERHIALAESLSEEVSEVERWFIHGSALFMRGQPTESRTFWERILAREPNHFWALGNLSLARRDEGDDAGARALLVDKARTHVEHLASQMLAYELLIDERRGAEASEFLDRARTLTPPDRRRHDLWLSLAQACESWKRKDVVAARLAADRAAATLAPLDSAPAHNRYSLGLVYLSLGMAVRAHAMIADVRHDERDYTLALVEAVRDRWAEAGRLLAGVGSDDRRTPASATIMTDAGLPDDAARLLARWDREKYWPDWLVAPLRASVLAGRGDRKEALRVLNAALPRLKYDWWTVRWTAGMPTGSIPLFAALRLQARLLAEEGRLDAAIETLETGRADEVVACNGVRSAGAFYLAMLGDLVQLYRRRDDTNRALAIESELRERLAVADPEFPLLRAVGLGDRAASEAPATSRLLLESVNTEPRFR